MRGCPRDATAVTTATPPAAIRPMSIPAQVSSTTRHSPVGPNGESRPEPNQDERPRSSSIPSITVAYFSTSTSKGWSATQRIPQIVCSPRVEDDHSSLSSSAAERIPPTTRRRRAH